MEATARTINMDNLRATGRMAEKQVNVALEQAELNGEVIPQEVMNFLNAFKDDATRDAIFKAPDKAGVQKILNDSGVPMAEEDVNSLLEALGKAGKQLVESDGKLTEAELEQISGGGIGSWFKKAWNWCTSTTVGTIITYSVIVGVGMALICAGGAALMAGTLAVVGKSALAGAAFAGGGTALIMSLSAAHGDKWT